MFLGGNKMKRKLIALLLILSVLLGFAACGKKATDETTTAAPEETTAAEESSETAAETEQNTDASETQATSEAPSQGNNPTEAPSSPSGDVISNSSTKQQIADYYNKATAATKKANKLRGKESVELSKISVNNNDSGAIISFIKGILGSVIESNFEVSDSKPIPYHDQEVNVLADDIKSFSVTDNGDTYTLKIMPKDDINPKKSLEGSTGRFFPIVENIKEIAAGVPGVKFEGGVEQGVTADYKDAVIEVKIDKKTYEIVGGTYSMNIYLNINKASASIFKVDKATAIISYKLVL